MIYALSLAVLTFVLSPVQIKAPQVPLNPYSIAEDYQRLYNLRILNDGGPAKNARDQMTAIATKYKCGPH